MQKHKTVFYIFILSSFSLFGQVQKDTLLGKWGHHTVWNKSINDEEYKNIETNIDNIYQFDRKLLKEDFYQDLGAVGSSYRSLNFLNNRSVFKELNQDMFENYGFAKEQKFYKTYGPFSQIEYDFRGKDNTFLEGIYTRNVNERWNLGFQFRRLRYGKLYTITNPPNLLSSTALRFFTSYRSKNNRYQLLADYHSLNHNQLEQGGIDLENNSIIEGYFQWYNLNDNISATTRFETRNYFLRHSYSLDSLGKFVLFHQLDRKNEFHKFVDDKLDYIEIDSTKKLLKFYPEILRDSLRTFSFWELNSIKNQFGIRGKWGNIQYQSSLHLRSYNYEIEKENNKYVQEIALEIASSYAITDSSSVKAQILQSQTGAFHYEFNYKNKWIEATLVSKNSLPYLFHERFLSNHYRWDSTWKNTQLNAFNIFVKPKKNLRIGVSYQVITNYMYFDSKMNIQQEKTVLSMLSPELFYNAQSKHFAFKTHLKYTVFTGNKVLGIPNFNSVTKIFYKAELFKKALKANIGVEIRSFSDYYSYGYMPTTHSFYYQDSFKAYFTPNTVGFLNFRIKNATIFFRGNNLLEYVTGWNFETPYYPQRPLGFVFGVNWSFFD